MSKPLTSLIVWILIILSPSENGRGVLGDRLSIESLSEDTADEVGDVTTQDTDTEEKSTEQKILENVNGFP